MARPKHPFAEFFKSLRESGDNPRSELIRRLRISDEVDNPETLRHWRLHPTDPSQVIYPEDEAHFLRNLEGISPELRAAAIALWAEFANKDAPAKSAADRTSRVAEWTGRAQEALDAPVQMATLDEVLRTEPAALKRPPAGGVLALRNQVSIKEFIVEILGLPYAGVNHDTRDASAALTALEGWTRLPKLRLHRGSHALVFRRDGTDGKPSALPQSWTDARGRRKIV